MVKRLWWKSFKDADLKWSEIKVCLMERFINNDDLDN